MRIKKGDIVVIIAGAEKGQTGEVLQVLRKTERVVVKGINVVTKHNRPSNANPDGGITQKEAPISISNVAYLDPVEKKATKIGYKKEENGKKVRFCKLSGTVIK